MLGFLPGEILTLLASLIGGVAIVVGLYHAEYERQVDWFEFTATHVARRIHASASERGDAGPFAPVDPFVDASRDLGTFVQSVPGVIHVGLFRIVGDSVVRIA